jgi:bifunctional DNase/RNase
MIEVKIDSIRVSLTNQQRIVILKELNRERYLPIWIGPFEAEAITIGLQSIEISRPQTHDLLLDTIRSLGYQVKYIEIKYMQEAVFYADLVLSNLETEEEKRIDCRPSDALALCARKNYTIYIAEEILEDAGVIPDQGIQVKKTFSEADEKIEVKDEGRLSVFEDFLEQLGEEDSINDDDSEEDSAEDQEDLN